MTEEIPAPVILSGRFADAVGYASQIHHDQTRKGSGMPYIAHLLGAASLVLEQPGVTEDQAIAAMLHDAIEDQPDRTSLDTITQRFGPAVAQIVSNCTDADSHPKPPWRHRKQAYLHHLEEVQLASLQVSLADKVHNARAILEDLRSVGDDVWSRFSAPPVAQRWYYRSLAEVFSRRVDNQLSETLNRTVQEMTAGLPEQVVLSPSPGRPAWVGTHGLTGAATTIEEAEHTVGQDLQPANENAWTTADGRWWVQPADTGDPFRPNAIFVHVQAS
ncbi:hypothetical protein BH24ACT15_BH24ACT15_29200 [soil metagenome]